jgi:hypothetical protein
LVTVGATLGFGDSDAQQIVDFLEAVAGQPIGDTENVRFKFRSIRLLFGFET